MLSRELIVADHVSAELLGPGDLVRPWQAGVRDRACCPSTRCGRCSRRSRSRCSTAASRPRWRASRRSPPRCSTACRERSLRLATTQAISQLTRVDRRLKALFWHLAERWGRVGGDGVVVPLALTHRILGQLVGARRPTVSTALSELAERDELTRRRDGSWLLRGDPPDASTLARAPSAAELRGQTCSARRGRFTREREHVDTDALVAAIERRGHGAGTELRELLERRGPARS